MINGRHLLLLGLLACAGLVSVHDGQIQTDHCYKIASQEKELRQIRDKIELEKIKHTALQSPRAVMERAAVLSLKVVPPSFSALGDVNPNPSPVVTPPTIPHRSLGTPQGARPGTVPTGPTTKVTPMSTTGTSTSTSRRALPTPATMGH